MSREPEGRRDLARVVALGAVVVVLVAFVVDNIQSVRVGFVFFERQPPLIWVLLVTAVLGAVTDRLARWFRHRS